MENIKVASEASLCYLDIDKTKVQLPEEMAVFPHLHAFNTEISSVLDKYGVHVTNTDSTRSYHVSLINFNRHVKFRMFCIRRQRLEVAHYRAGPKTDGNCQYTTHLIAIGHPHRLVQPGLKRSKESLIS